MECSLEFPNCYFIDIVLKPEMTKIKYIKSMCISYAGTIEKGLNGKIRKNGASQLFFKF